MKKLLLILILGLWMLPSKAQYYFNKRETLHSLNTVLTSVVQKNDKYYCTGLCLDSLNYTGTGNLWYTRFGVKFTVFDKAGNILRDTFYQKPGRRIYTWNSKLTPMSDNSFVLMADNTDTANYHVLIMRFDSMGHLLFEKEIDKPVCAGINNDFWRMVDFKQDSEGNWLLLTTLKCNPSGNFAQHDFFLMKLDSSFNVLWYKQYGTNWDDQAGHLLIEPDGYLLAGGRDNGNMVALHFTMRAQLIKTDTAGNVQWSWLSNANKLTGPAMDVIRTQDGGYVYCGSGDGYEQLSANQQYSTPEFHGWVEKLDANRNIVWSKSFNYWTGTTNLKKIIETPSGNLQIFGDKYDAEQLDSTNWNLRTNGWFLTLNANGDSLTERLYSFINTCRDFNSIYDVKQTSDGGFIMCGESTDKCAVSQVPPTQRGWLVKVDSNGCLGPGDPQCWPVSVGSMQLAKEEVKLYPNPVSRELFIRLATGNGQYATIIITDITGKELLQQTLSSNINTIDMQNFSSGVYLYRIVSSQGILQQGKVVKE